MRENGALCKPVQELVFEQGYMFIVACSSLRVCTITERIDQSTFNTKSANAHTNLQFIFTHSKSS